MNILNSALFQKQWHLRFIGLILMASIMPSLSYAAPTINVTRLAEDNNDLHVYSTNNEYTDLDQYSNLRVKTYISASRFGSNENTFSIRANPWSDLGGEYRVNIGPRSASNFTLIAVKSVRPNAQYNWILDGEIPHRVMAAFAINVCNANIERKLGFARSRGHLFTEDYTLGMYMQYFFSTRFDNGSGYPTATQNFSTINVHSERKVICHKNASEEDLPRPPNDELIVRNVKIDFLPLVQDGSKSCNIATKIEILTNKPNEVISYHVQHQKGTERRPGFSNLHGPYQLRTDQNGVANGRFDATNIDSGLDRGNFAIGQLRVVGDSSVFQSRLLPYQVDCHRRVKLNTNEISSVPEVRIPRNKLPRIPHLSPPDAPDSRLKQVPISKRIPSVVPVSPNDKLNKYKLPTNAATIKSEPSGKQIKKKQLIEKNIKPVISEPISGEKIQQDYEKVKK